jgi:hypothetical protein
MTDKVHLYGEYRYFGWSPLAADRFNRTAARRRPAGRLTLKIEVKMEVRRG